MIRRRLACRRNRHLTVVINMRVVVLLVCGGACAAFADNAVCYDSQGQTQYVNESQKMIEQGISKLEVLDTLYCIWRNDALELKARAGAFRALVHIACDDKPRLRKYLVAAIEESPETPTSCDPKACRVLMYVADTASRKVLLTQLKKHWEGNCEEAYNALLQWGDEGLIAWLEERMEALPADHPERVWCAEQLRFARSLRSLEDILAYLHTDRRGVSSYEVIRQAIRHGATRDDLRRYYFERVARYDGTKRSKLRARNYVRTALERGVFDKSDIEKLPEALQVTERAEDDLEDHSWPGWATGEDELRRAFWGPYRLDGKEKQSCDK